jgi:hypothetical protein
MSAEIGRVLRDHAQPRGPELLGGGGLFEAMDQGTQHTRQKRDARATQVQVGAAASEVRWEPRPQPCPLLHHAHGLGRQ